MLVLGYGLKYNHFTKPLVEQIKKRKVLWYGHVIRMAEERKPRQILGARPTGKR
jgi:hypothetical protein